MAKEPISCLGIGPMSEIIIEAVFRYSAERSIPLMLIASKNQIDWDGGYVNCWKTREYMTYVEQLRCQYPLAKIYCCRDHCGPGFKTDDLEDVYATIDADIECGFDLIHVDFCHHSNDHQEVLHEARKAIEYIRNRDPDMMIEVGTDENRGVTETDDTRLEKDLKFFTDLGPIEFFVVQTGSLLKEIQQVGAWDMSLLRKIRSLGEKYDVCFKEHNCDYLPIDAIKQRKGLIDAMNVAPQYGVLQTMLTLEKAALYGIDASEFLNEAYASGKWKKWLYKNTSENKYLCALIAGHYVFSSDAYSSLFDAITRHEDLKECLIEELMKNFSMYVAQI